MSSSPDRPSVPGNGIEAVLVFNHWATPAQIARARAAAGNGPDADKGLVRALLDQHVLDAESHTQLETILRNQRQLEGFTLLKKVGSGGMGTVYLARHHKDGQQVAIKVINTRLADDGDFLSRFHRETRALVNLRHPNLANVIHSGATESTHFMAMEYVNGPALSNLLKDYRALPEDYVLRMVRQVAECLGYVYAEAGIVHRDIKPENILVQRNPAAVELFPADDCAKLIDFGLVKVANDDQHLTQTGMTIGTPLYMSPEQVRGEQLDCRCDIYGLGATAFHLLTGLPPFRASSPGAIMSAHLTEPVPDPGTSVPGLSASTRRLVMTALAKKQTERFLSYDALIKACDEASEQLAQRAGAGLRLLRKPLVISKPPPRKQPSDRLRAAGSGDHTPPPGQEPLVSPSTRIALKHHEKKQASQSDSDRLRNPQLHRSLGAEPEAEPQESRTDLRASGSSGTRALEKIRDHPDAIPAVIVPEMARRPAERSAAFQEDAQQPLGTGLLPWILLGLALLAAITYGAWQLLG